MLDSLADNFSGVGQILKDGVMNGSEGTRTRTGLLQALLARDLGEDSALSDKENMTVREFLLEFTSETKI